MYLKSINIQNFRNYEQQKINLSKDINIFYGDNKKYILVKASLK